MKKKNKLALIVISLLAITFYLFNYQFAVGLQGDEIRLGETGSHAFVKIIIDAETKIDEITLSGDVVDGVLRKYYPYDHGRSDRSYWGETWGSAQSFCRDQLTHGANNCYSVDNSATCAWQKSHNKCYDTGRDPCGSRTSIICVDNERTPVSNLKINIADKSILSKSGIFSGAFETDDFSKEVNIACASQFKHFAETGESSTCEIIVTAKGDYSATESPKIKNIEVNHISGKVCIQKPACDSWSECIGGTMTRVCKDLNNCGMDDLLPTTTKDCEMQEPTETCQDFGLLSEIPVENSEVWKAIAFNVDGNYEEVKISNLVCYDFIETDEEITEEVIIEPVDDEFTVDELENVEIVDNVVSTVKSNKWMGWLLGGLILLSMSLIIGGILIKRKK